MAARKARDLLDCGAAVTVIAPALSDDMEALAPSLHAARAPALRPGDASAFRLVVTATGHPEVDGAVYADAEAAGVWVNSADDPAHCSFILPAVHRDGAVTVAVSTGGLSPRSPPGSGPAWRRSAAAGSGPWPSCWARPGRSLKRAGLRSDAVDWARTARRPAARARAGRRHRQRPGNCGGGHRL